MRITCDDVDYRLRTRNNSLVEFKVCFLSIILEIRVAAIDASKMKRDLALHSSETCIYSKFKSNFCEMKSIL